MSYAAATRAAGPEQNWLPLSDSTYLDDAAAGALPATIAGHGQPLLERLELNPVLASRADDPLPAGAEVIYLAAGCFWGVEVTTTPPTVWYARARLVTRRLWPWFMTRL